MLRGKINQQALDDIISGMAREYEYSDCHTDRKLKEVLHTLVELSLNAPGTRSMEVIDILSSAVLMALQREKVKATNTQPLFFSNQPREYAKENS